MFERLLNVDALLGQSFFLFGPRGVGKTSWIKEKYQNALYFDLLNDDVYKELLSRPVRLGEKIPSNYADWVVLDEIQKVPALLNEVHRLIESRNLRFVLTGSSARSLRRQGVNLLAGRALTYHMHPLSVLELGDGFDLKRALQYGHLPMAVTSMQPKKYLQSYVATYLREEVLQEGLTRNLSLFSRFLEVASFSQGEVVSYTDIAREIGTNRHTVGNFFDILDDLLIAVRLPVFRKRAKRNVIAHPKFYYFDAGVYRTIRPVGPLDTSAEVDGAVLETLFLEEARAMNDYFELGYMFYYWRTRGQQEVDFILYGENGFHAFEIKRKEKLSAKDFSGLKAFSEDYPEAKLHMFYGGREGYIEGDIRVHGFEQGLRTLPSILQGSAKPSWR